MVVDRICRAAVVGVVVASSGSPQTLILEFGSSVVVDDVRVFDGVEKTLLIVVVTPPKVGTSGKKGLTPIFGL